MLKFYIISTICSVVVIFITVLSVNAELRREGYQKPERASIEKLRSWLPAFFPILNIAMAIVCILKYEELLGGRRKEWTK